MQVTTVHYERKYSDNNYGNFGLGMTGQLGEGESPVEAADLLRDTVEHILSTRQDHAEEDQRAARQAARLRHEIAALEDEVARAKKKWEDASAFLRVHGLDPQNSFDPPF